MTSLLRRLLLLPLLPLLLQLSRAQQLPDNPCAAYFQYVRGGSGSGGIQGELTLSLQNGRNHIEVRFSQRGTQDHGVVGALKPYPDDPRLRANYGFGKFRLDLLPDASGVLPKLTRLALNDATLCSTSDYNHPSSYFNRFYIMDAPRQLNPSAIFDSSPRQLNPPVVFDSSPSQQGSDVEFKTVIINTPAGKQLPQDTIPNLLADWVKEQTSTSVAVPWPTPTTTTTTASLPIPVSSPWPVATPAPLPVLKINRFNPSPVSSLLACGQEGTTTPFILRGEEFPRGRYPWLTAIYHKESFALAFRCGGSLISASLVITAAHCVYKVKEDRVLVAIGRYDLDNYNEDGAETRDAIRIVSHPDFSTRLHQQPDADIALITIERPVTFNDVIRPICLWEAAAEEIEAEIGSIAGWGTDEFGNSMTRYPRVVEAKVATEAECARKWKVQRPMDRTICAGNLDGSGPCLGDSGGGLMIKRNNRWLLRGIVSQGERNSAIQCNPNQYVLYCDLSKHLTWISQNLR